MPDRITSIQNPRVKDAVKLRDRAGREAQQLFIIDGAREILRALDAGIEVVELFVCDELLRLPSKAVVTRAEQQIVRVTLVSPAVHTKLAFGDRNEGLVAIARPRRVTLNHLSLPQNPLIAVIDGLEKPGNLGAIVRSADATGVAAVIAADVRTDLFNPNAIRASAGTLFTVPMVAACAMEIRNWLRQRQVRVFAARTGCSRSFLAADYTHPTAFVLGNEATGLDQTWNEADITAISLPMRGVADSLNVSVTAAVLFYEALRQRGTAGKQKGSDGWDRSDG